MNRSESCAKDTAVVGELRPRCPTCHPMGVEEKVPNAPGVVLLQTVQDVERVIGVLLLDIGLDEVLRQAMELCIARVERLLAIIVLIFLVVLRDAEGRCAKHFVTRKHFLWLSAQDLEDLLNILLDQS